MTDRVRREGFDCPFTRTLDRLDKLHVLDTATFDLLDARCAQLEAAQDAIGLRRAAGQRTPIPRRCGHRRHRRGRCGYRVEKFSTAAYDALPLDPGCCRFSLSTFERNFRETKHSFVSFLSRTARHFAPANRDAHEE